MKYPVHIFLLIFLFEGCCYCDLNEPLEAEQPEYTFAVAGHVYGHSQRFTGSLYPPFSEKIKQDISDFEIDFLVLTGDVVPEPDEANWRRVNDELNELGIEWYLAPGNHDYGGLRQQITGKPDFFGFKKNEDLFLILNTTNPGWTVDSIQRTFISDQINRTDSIGNIFVFTHQLWWLRNDPAEYMLDSITTNSNALYSGKSDFWTDGFGFFKESQRPIWFFAGDLGAHEFFKSYYEDHYKRFHFYGSGMGGGIRDNYLLVSVFRNGRVSVIKREF